MIIAFKCDKIIYDITFLRYIQKNTYKHICKNVFFCLLMENPFIIFIFKKNMYVFIYIC